MSEENNYTEKKDAAVKSDESSSGMVFKECNWLFDQTGEV